MNENHMPNRPVDSFQEVSPPKIKNHIMENMENPEVS